MNSLIKKDGKLYAYDLELLILIELLQPRTEQVQDLGGNLLTVRPCESHQSKENLPDIPWGQFQAQRSDSTSISSIAHDHTVTPSQSKIFSDSYNNKYNNRTLNTSTPSQREIGWNICQMLRFATLQMHKKWHKAAWRG